MADRCPFCTRSAITTCCSYCRKINQSVMFEAQQTPTKSTTKNNILTQVRIPQFDLEDDERQSIQVSTTDLTAATKSSTDQHMKCGEYSTENVKSSRILARERSAVRRAAFLPEEVEQERKLNRERNAARRATASPKEAEEQRASARERSAARRATLTQEEAEQQRILARERTAARRATLTPEEVEQQQRLTRERNAARRAAASPEEAEEQRASARERSAARRATVIQEEAEQQRILARERTAARRATLTPEEIEQQRKLTRERNAARRAAASPEEAEEQRASARERSAARRATLTPEETEQRQQTTTRKKNHLQTTVQRKQMATQKKTSEDIRSEWPKPAEIGWKISCLKNFIHDMSMISLAEGVCGICNVRCYKCDLRCVPLSKIPSIELLKVHNDLLDIIPGIQSMNNLTLKDSFGKVDDLDLLVVGHDDKEGYAFFLA